MDSVSVRDHRPGEKPPLVERRRLRPFSLRARVRGARRVDGGWRKRTAALRAVSASAGRLLGARRTRQHRQRVSGG
jgi:hypothetical protein